MDWMALAAIVTAVVAVVVAVVNGRTAITTQRLQASTSRELAAGQQAVDKEETAGELALSIARRSEARLNALEDYHYEAGGWYERHSDRDRQVERELVKLDPTFQIPATEPFPRLRRVEASAT